MTKKITDHVCTPTPNRLAFDVEMETFANNSEYRALVLSAADYLKECLKANYSDYANLRGVSSVEFGVPWNIIAYKDQCQQVRVCINPRIVTRSKMVTTLPTKCPSFRTSYDVKRHDSIDLTFHDMNGQKVLLANVTRSQGGFCIQHEVNHNMGISPRDEGVLTTVTAPAAAAFGNTNHAAQAAYAGYGGMGGFAGVKNHPCEFGEG